ncbi:MAG: DEAD/DEAH box helicase [Polyangiaceae bacterium]|nr:DEAD/DEAH box helicase [Polyangiaceae bacterium]
MTGEEGKAGRAGPTGTAEKAAPAVVVVTHPALRAPFETRAEVLAWLEQHGIAHLARLNAEVLTPLVDPALRSSLRAVGARRRLLDLASAEALARSSDWLRTPRLLETLPPLAWRYLEDEREDAALARATIAERLRPPEASRALAVHTSLRALRDRLSPSLAPRPASALAASAAGALRCDAALPGFRYEDPRASEAPARVGGGFAKPEVRLTLTPGAPRAECSCGAAGGDCVHVLSAIDTALHWLHQPVSEAFLGALAELARPAWQRTLLALEQALEQTPEDRAGIELDWRLRVVDNVGVEAAPWVRRLGKRGQPGAAKRLGRRHLLFEHGAALRPEDARIATLLPEREGFAPRALLEALIGHARVFLEDEPERAVLVDRAPVGLVAEDRRGTLRVSAGVDGTALPPALLARVRGGGADEVLFLWDGGRLTLLDVKAELRALLVVLAREGDLFPPESQGALLEALARWAGRLPVAMPRGVLGESVAASCSPVLRFEVQPDGSVEVELRIRPLPESNSFLPGDGARDVHVRRGERALHAVRDLRLEEKAAQQFWAELPLFDAEAQNRPFFVRFASAQGALALIEACGRRDDPPELEWVGSALRVIGRRGPRALKVSLERRHEWFGALGGLSVEGERVELARLLDSARRKERYVQVGPQAYIELSDALRELLEGLADHARPSARGLEFGPSATESLRALEGHGAALEADAAWRTLARRVEASAELVAAPPPTLRAELRPYQLEGFRWLSRLAAWGAGGVLADDMGLGKTVQTLALLLDRAALGPALVVAPTSVAFNWVDEARRFAPSLRLALYADAHDREQALAELGPGDVLVISYGLLARDAERLAARRFATLAFDEAQHLKNATTHRSRAARSLQADFRVALSGTPLENHLGELWGLFAAVYPALLGSWESFRRRYAAPIERQADPSAAPALARVLAPFLLRRTKAQVETELPPRTEVRVPVVLSSAEWQLYEDARLAALSDLESRKSQLREQDRRVEVLAALTRLRLLASHPRLYDPNSELTSAKLARLLELVEELLAAGQRTLIFSQFTSHLALVREALGRRGIDFLYLDGGTPRPERGELVRAFQEGRAPFFLISLKAGGFGINLTAATNVILLDPWWNPAVEDQASDRAHRPGQDRPVTIYRLVAMGTIEEMMLTLHDRKRALAAEVLEGKEGAGKLSTQDLLGLLAQPRPAVQTPWSTWPVLPPER